MFALFGVRPLWDTVPKCISEMHFPGALPRCPDCHMADPALGNLPVRVGQLELSWGMTTRFLFPNALEGWVQAQHPALETFSWVCFLLRVPFLGCAASFLGGNIYNMPAKEEQ